MPIMDLTPVRNEILEQLSVEPLTVNELAIRLGRAYTTVQQAHKLLKDDNEVIRYDGKLRGGKWTINPSREYKASGTIPVVKYLDNVYSMTQFQGVKDLPQRGFNAADSIMRAWVSIAMTAVRMQSGNFVGNDALAKRLRPTKAELIKARTELIQLQFLIQQMLDNDNFWDLDAIAAFPEDPEWETFRPKLLDMYEHYFNPKDK